MAAKFSSKNADPGQPRLTNQQVEYLLASVVRIPELFAAAKRLLKPDHFSFASEKAYRALWIALLNISSNLKDTTLLNGMSLSIDNEIIALRNDSPDILDDQEAAALLDPDNGLITWITSLSNDDLNPEIAKSFLKRFIQERAADKASRILDRVRTHGVRISDLQKVKEELEEAVNPPLVSDENLERSVFDNDMLNRPKRKMKRRWSTGCSYFDLYLNGGHAGGEVYTLMGPTGVGKTMNALQLTIRSALEQEAMAKTPGNEITPGVCCYFSFEMQFDELVTRAWSNAAEIHSSTFDEADGIDGIQEYLSTTGNLKAYEVQRFSKRYSGKSIKNIPGELERLRNVNNRLKPYLYLYDCSGLNPDNAVMGSNGLDDVLVTLNKLAARGKRIAMVVIDYAGLMVKRYMATHGINLDSGMRHYLGDVVISCLQKIAIPYDCPVWVLQQVNPSANRKAPGALIHHSESSEDGAFSTNAAFAFQLSTKDPQRNACTLFCTKSRRYHTADIIPPILRIVGEFATIEDASTELTYDNAQKCYRDKNYNHVASPAAIGNRGGSGQRTRRSPTSQLDPGELMG